MQVKPAVPDAVRAQVNSWAERAGLQACAVLLGTALLAAPLPARADPNDYVLTLDYAGGERELEAKLGAASSARGGAPAAQAAAFAWGLAVNDSWFTEFYAQFANSTSGAGGGGFDAVSWENIVRFSEPGEWPVDVGAMLEIERPHAASQGWKITTGPLLQRDFGAVQVNANALLSRAVDGGPYDSTQLSYQFQARYRSDPRLEVGMQALGDVGTWNHWGSPYGRQHRAGPAIFGSRKLGPGSNLNFNAALLFGLSRDAADTTLRAQIEYEY